MDNKSLKLTVLTPDRKLLSEVEVTEISVPGFRGELGILPGHAPLMTTLETGILKYRERGSEQYSSIVVSWGYCQVATSGVTILSETAERADEIDSKRALAAWKLSTERLDSGQLDLDGIEKYRRKQRRADLRRQFASSGRNETSH